MTVYTAVRDFDIALQGWTAIADTSHITASLRNLVHPFPWITEILILILQHIRKSIVDNTVIIRTLIGGNTTCTSAHRTGAFYTGFCFFTKLLYIFHRFPAEIVFQTRIRRNNVRSFSSMRDYSMDKCIRFCELTQQID